MTVFSFPGIQISTAGISTEAKQDAQITLQTTANASLSSIDGKLSTIDSGIPAALGQTTMSASMPVVIASNQSAVPVSGTFWQTTQPVSAASLPLPTGAATETTLAALNTKVTAVNTGAVTISSALPAGSNIIGNVRIDQTTPGTTNGSSLSHVGSTAVATGNGVVGTGVQRVAIASDNTAFSVNAVQSGTWTVQPGNTANTTAWLFQNARAATSSVTSVASSATSVTLLASNAARKGATVFNDSTAILYLKFGATASATSYTVQIAAGGYYEFPGPTVYSGVVDGIWSAANGNARLTELS